MFNQHVLGHYQNPRYKGAPPEEGVIAGEFTNETCGDFIEIWYKPKGQFIENVWWWGRGCCFSQAAASMLAEHLVGKSLSKMEWEFGLDDMLELFQADFEPGRIECIATAYHAFHNALENQ